MTLRANPALASVVSLAALSVAVLAGCATYNPPGIASMSAVDMCELEYMQGRNLSPAARQTIQSELQRRNDSCANHRVEVAQRFEDFMLRETYGKLNDP